MFSQLKFVRFWPGIASSATGRTTRRERLNCASTSRDSALRVLSPGKPEGSKLLKRISSDDPGVVMPPPAVKNPLTVAQKQALREWIAKGATYSEHWAFMPPKRPEMPKVKNANWPRNAIDYFILARLEAEGLSPSPEADRYMLVAPAVSRPDRPAADARGGRGVRERQIAESLRAIWSTGCWPPALWRALGAALARPGPLRRYQRLRKGSPALDLALSRLGHRRPQRRHAVRPVHHRATGRRHAAERHAESQRIATGFHRNTMLNEEGGIDPLEFRFYAMTDRVATTGTVWLGLTLGCAQCHTHKFDPIPQREYYQFIGLPQQRRRAAVGCSCARD